MVHTAHSKTATTTTHHLLLPTIHFRVRRPTVTGTLATMPIARSSSTLTHWMTKRKRCSLKRKTKWTRPSPEKPWNEPRRRKPAPTAFTVRRQVHCSRKLSLAFVACKLARIYLPPPQSRGLCPTHNPGRLRLRMMCHRCRHHQELFPFLYRHRHHRHRHHHHPNNVHGTGCCVRHHLQGSSWLQRTKELATQHQLTANHPNVLRSYTLAPALHRKSVRLTSPQ